MRRRSALLVSAGVVVALLTGCLPAARPWATPTTTGVGDGHYVGIIGDSLVFRAQYSSDINWEIHLLDDALAANGFHASVSALMGAATPDIFGANYSQFVGFPEPGADIQIIGLGTNDANNNAVPVEDFEANLRRYIASQPASTCFRLINVYTGATSWGLDVTAPAYNAALDDIAADQPNVSVIDWNSIALAHPEYFGTDPTQPHANASGEAAYRFIITFGAAGCAQTLE